MFFKSFVNYGVQLIRKWILDKFDVSSGNPNMSGMGIVSGEISGGFSVSMM